jgi:hypothetical protein
MVERVRGSNVRPPGAAQGTTGPQIGVRAWLGRSEEVPPGSTLRALCGGDQAMVVEPSGGGVRSLHMGTAARLVSEELAHLTHVDAVQVTTQDALYHIALFLVEFLGFGVPVRLQADFVAPLATTEFLRPGH